MCKLKTIALWEKMQNGKPNDNNPYRKTCIQVNTVRGPLDFFWAERACSGVKISTDLTVSQNFQKKDGRGTHRAIGRLLKRAGGRFYSWVEKKGGGVIHPMGESNIFPKKGCVFRLPTAQGTCLVHRTFNRT